MRLSALWLLAGAMAAAAAAEPAAPAQRLVQAVAAFRRELQSGADFEAVATRQLHALVEAADSDDEAAARAIFALYAELYPTQVSAWGATESAQFQYFYQNVYPTLEDKAVEELAASTPRPSGTTSATTKPSGTTAATTKPSTTSTAKPSTTSKPSTTATPTPTPKTSTNSSSKFTVKSSSSIVEVSSSLTFFSNIYDPNVASDILALQDNTQNIEAIVASASGTSTTSAPSATTATPSTSSSSSSTTTTHTYTAPTVLNGYTAPTSGRRFLASGSSSAASTANVNVLFCDVSGNSIWQWSAQDIPIVAFDNISTTTTTIEDEENGLCKATTTTLSVSAYQSGCSLQNHPEGCGNVYYKGCGGLTVSPTTGKIVVARTGGRSLGVLSYVSTGGACQGQVVDAISTFRGRKFNSPTYAEYSELGVLYFTDSPFGLATSAEDLDSDALDSSPLREIPFNGVYMLQPGANQSVELVDCDMDRPNKIAFSPQQDKMYVTNSRINNSYVKEFSLADDGSVTDSRVFFNFTAYPELETSGGYANGIKTDDSGNVYVVASNKVFILSANGTLAGSIVSNQALDSVALGVGRMFITGGFGIVAQTSGIEPSSAIPQAQTTCASR